jgi:serine/threonine protein kinase
MDRYQKIEKNGHVGEGTYGVVYKAKDKQTDEIVALKVQKQDHSMTLTDVKRWLLIISTLCHVFPCTENPFGSGR